MQQVFSAISICIRVPLSCVLASLILSGCGGPAPVPQPIESDSCQDRVDIWHRYLAADPENRKGEHGASIQRKLRENVHCAISEFTVDLRNLVESDAYDRAIRAYEAFDSWLGRKCVYIPRPSYSQEIQNLHESAREEETTRLVEMATKAIERDDLAGAIELLEDAPLQNAEVVRDLLESTRHGESERLFEVATEAFERGDYEMAIKTCEKMPLRDARVRSLQRRAEAHFEWNRAEILFEQGALREALPIYEKVERLDQAADFPELSSRKAYVYKHGTLRFAVEPFYQRSGDPVAEVLYHRVLEELHRRKHELDVIITGETIDRIGYWRRTYGHPMPLDELRQDAADIDVFVTVDIAQAELAMTRTRNEEKKAWLIYSWTEEGQKKYDCDNASEVHYTVTTQTWEYVLDLRLTCSDVSGNRGQLVFKPIKETNGQTIKLGYYRGNEDDLYQGRCGFFGPPAKVQRSIFYPEITEPDYVRLQNETVEAVGRETATGILGVSPKMARSET